MTRDELADELMEIRRYVRKDVEYVKKTLRGELVDGAWKSGLLDDLIRLENRDDDRLHLNLVRALNYIQVDPEVLECYLYAAAFELRCNGKEK